MHFKKILIIAIFYGNLYANDAFSSGVWFSDRQEFRNGFENLQLVVEEKNFTLAKLSYNEEKKWEETRVLGVVIKNKKGEFLLKPEMCSVYASKILGLRWILIQGFDCDHIEMQITKTGQGIFISPSIGIKDSVLLTGTSNFEKNKIQGRVISIEKEKFFVWSLRMRHVKKNASALLNGKPISILETVDSTGTFESKDSVQIGDSISITNKEGSLFD